MELIEKINILMKKNNIRNLAHLSRKTEIPYTTLKSILNGDVNDIRLSTSKKICDFFHITLDELLDDNTKLKTIRHSPLNEIDTEGLDEEDIEEIKRFVEFIKNKKKKN